MKIGNQIELLKEARSIKGRAEWFAYIEQMNKEVERRNKQNEKNNIRNKN